jgi:hypothetical protein
MSGNWNHEDRKLNGCESRPSEKVFAAGASTPAVTGVSVGNEISGSGAFTLSNGVGGSGTLGKLEGSGCPALVKIGDMF